MTGKHYYVVANVAGDVRPLIENELEFWPGYIRDPLLMAIERKSQELGKPLIPTNYTCDQDDGVWFVRIDLIVDPAWKPS